jgi:hypothetical protein
VQSVAPKSAEAALPECSPDKKPYSEERTSRDLA